MDTSETYIKMCDCPEIQKYIPSLAHQWSQSFWHYYMRDKDPLWLPRQDQIQEMMLGMSQFQNRVLKPIFELMDDFGYFLFAEDIDIDNDLFESIEQLWLAFYMYEKYSKIWDGDKWVKK